MRRTTIDTDPIVCASCVKGWLLWLRGIVGPAVPTVLCWIRDRGYGEHRCMNSPR